MTIRYPLPYVDRWSDADGNRYEIISAPPEEEWVVLAHHEDGSTSVVAPATGAVTGYYRGGDYDSRVQTYWDLASVSARDIEIRRPDSAAILLSEFARLEEEQEAHEGGWATATDVASVLLQRGLSHPERTAVLTATSHEDLGDFLEYRDQFCVCDFHHFDDAESWLAAPGGWILGSAKATPLVKVTASVDEVATSIDEYIRTVLWS